MSPGDTKMKIFITGNTHQGIDIGKLSTRLFVEQKKLTKEDFLIICGDVGLLWNNSKEELFWRKWMADKNFTTLFIDGNHENFNLLYDFPLKKWNGGWVRFINDSLIHLSRG